VSHPPLRLFCAVELPQPVREDLHARLRPWRAAYPEAKWVAVDNLHITLKFIGDVAEDDAERIDDALAAAAAQQGPFGIHLVGAGVFGPPRAVRVIWLGIGAGQGPLAALAADLERLLLPLGVAADGRPYRAHLTIARCRGGALPDALHKGLRDAARADWGRLEVSRIVLMQSHLRPEGPAYEPLAWHRLGPG